MSEKSPIDQTTQFGNDLPDMGDEALEGEQPFIAEPKRRLVDSGAILLFGLLAAVGAGTYLMILSAGAQARGASATTAAADSAINAFLNSGVENLKQTFNTQRDTEKLVSQFNNPTANQVPLSALKTNPFQSPDAQTHSSTPLSESTVARLERERRAAAAAVANGLKLQSLVYGAHPLCMINGKSYAQGEGTESFTVVKIQPDSVWLRIGTLEFELKMAPPQF
jgi:type II secretory pathway pseudopilin PulG